MFWGVAFRTSREYWLYEVKVDFLRLQALVILIFMWFAIKDLDGPPSRLLEAPFYVPKGPLGASAALRGSFWRQKCPPIFLVHGVFGHPKSIGFMRLKSTFGVF